MSPKEVRRTSTDVHFGVAAAIEAARDAGLEVDEPSRVGVVIGSVMGGLSYTLRQQAILEERGWERVSPHWLRHAAITAWATQMNVPAAQRLAGHRNVATTSRYLGSTDAELKELYKMRFG